MDEDEDAARRWLARELHDTVAARLTEMLVEMELLCRVGGPPELGDWQGTIRAAIMDVRRALNRLRDEEASTEAVGAGLQRKAEGAIAGTRRSRAANAPCAAEAAPSSGRDHVIRVRAKGPTR
jgi:signal transduction histidine kinase